MHTGAKIKDLRLSHGYSYAAFSKEVGISTRVLSRIEKQDVVKQKYIDKIERRFNISINDYKVNIKDKSLGDKILYFRIRKGFTRTKLANELNIDKTYLSAIEHGNRVPSARLLLRISELLQVNIKQFLSEPPKDDEPSGEKLRYYRRLKGMTQRELAELVNVNTTYIGRIERNIIKLSDDKRAKFAKILEIDENKLK